MENTYEMVANGFTDTSEVPKGKALFYRCLKCGGVIPSLPKDSVGCTCFNVFIDKDYLRLVIHDYEKFEVVKRKDK